MNTPQANQIRAKFGYTFNLTISALALATLCTGCSSRSSYNSYSSSSRNYSSHSSNSNGSTSYDYSSNRSVNKSSASSTTVENIDSPLKGSGDITSEQLRAINNIIVTAGGTKVTVDELEYVNEKLSEADERPSAREVAVAVVQYRYAKMQDEQEARQRQLQQQQRQQQPQQGYAPYGGAPSSAPPSGYSGSYTPYRGLSQSEKQGIWSQHLPTYTQEERKRAVDPYGSNSNR